MSVSFSRVFGLIGLCVFTLEVRAEEPVPNTVAVDVSALDQQIFNSYDLTGFYKSLLLRIIQEKFLVSDSVDQAQILVAFRIHEDRMLITAQSGVFIATGEVLLHKENLLRLQFELIHQTMALIREISQKLQEESEALHQPALPQTFTPPIPLAPWALRAGLGGGGIWNPGAFGLGFELSNRLSKGLGWGLDLQLSLMKALGLGDEFQIMEWGIRAGGSYRWPLIKSLLSLDVIATLGFWQHRYRYDGSSKVDDAGNRLDYQLGLQSVLVIHLPKSLELGLQVELLTTGTDRAHRIGDRIVWKATALRGVVGFFLAFVFNL